MTLISRLVHVSFALAALALLASDAVAQARGSGTPTTIGVGTPPATPRIVAFVDATVLPMDRERTLEHQTVIIHDGRITTIAPSATTQVPAEALRIDARGKYLMPGIAEMHGHVPAQAGPFAEATMFLFVANGITTVRGMQGGQYHLALRDSIARGLMLGPKFYAAGPQIGNGRTPEQAIAMVVQQKQAGFDLLKIQEGLPRASYDSLVAAARRVGILFGGHVPDEVGLWHALESKQATIDHLDNFMEAVTAADFPADKLPAAGVGRSSTELDRRIAGAAAAARAAGVAVVPTQELWQMLYVREDSATLSKRPELRYMPANTVAGWYRILRTPARLATDEARRTFTTNRSKILKAVNDAGVLILLGTDAPQMFSVPGFSIHREMQAMVNAGMTPWEILRSGTRAVAVHLGTDAETGTVEVGKRADLILLNDNPLQSIANMQKRAGVMVNGKWLSEAEIQRRLEMIAAFYTTP
jgi:imidazolonepropionase-like amidohydrolase